MVCERTISLRVGLHLLPFRIGLECRPILLSLLPALMLEDVDKEVLRIRRVFGTPETNAFHLVSLENSIGVIAKASYESVHFALVNLIQAQFVDVSWRS